MVSNKNKKIDGKNSLRVGVAMKMKLEVFVVRRGVSSR